ncbi:MAG: Adenylosuccinate synthetase [Syntrophus sp. PtaB.Bin001]|nr:MAG: Adenylosuccinate synthetase [Syntrophus sp. PtaB.Bin001]
MVLVKQAVRVSGITGLAITKLDVLTGLKTLKICVGYQSENRLYPESVPPTPRILKECKPVYEEMDGWTEDIRNARQIDDLPANARRYLDRLESLAGVPIILVSVGAGREETIVLKNPFLD